MTRGARWFLGFLQEKANRNKQSWWGQQRMADELGCHRSSINRWVAELVAAGDLDSIRRGSTSNLYTLRKRAVEKPRQMPLIETSDVAKCDNATLEVNLPKEKKQAELAFPHPTITNEYGRTDPNPEFEYLSGVLRAALGRIRSARNPVAYERAIVQAELRALRKPARQESALSRAAGSGNPGTSWSG